MGYNFPPEIMEGYIPADERDWYPYEEPAKEWFKENKKRNPLALQERRKKITKLATNDFFFFCEVIMRNADDFHLQIGLHDVFCHILQKVSENPQIAPNGVLNLLPRLHLKSTLGSINYSIWLLGKNPNLRITILSATLDLPMKFLRSIQQHILYNKKLHYVFPKLKPAMAKGNKNHLNWNQYEITVARNKYSLKEPSVMIGSTEQSMTGVHTDYMIFDDVVTDKNADSPEKMKKIFQWEQDIQNTDDFDSVYIYHGTRYQDGDLYGDLIDLRNIPTLRRKAIEDGEYIWKEPANIRRVERKRKNLSAYNWACQYQNDPIVKGEQEFEADWIKYWNIELIREKLSSTISENDIDLLKKWYETLNIFMGCDPARTDKKDSDYTTMMVAGADKHGRMYVLDIIRKRMRSPDIVKNFIGKFDLWNPITAKIETYGGDVHIYNYIKKEMREQKKPYTRIREYTRTAHQTGNDRIRELQVPFSNGMVWIGKDSKFSEIVEELLRFPYGRHDDLITVMAYIWSQQIKPKKEKKKRNNVVWIGGKNRNTGIKDWKVA